MPIINGNVTDQNEAPVIGAQVFVYTAGGVLADCVDNLDQPITQPIITGEDGYWEAYVDDGFYTARYFASGRLRYVEANILAGDPPVGPNADYNLRTDLAASGGSALVGTIQSGTGASARTVQAKLREVAISVNDFGAVGVTSGAPTVNDTAAFLAAINAVVARGGGIVQYYARHLIDSNLTVPRGVTLEGPLGRADPGNPFAGRTGFFASLLTVPALFVNSAATITHQGAGGFSKCYIFRKGLVLDGTDLAANYAGTAITSGDTDAVLIRDCSLLGFQNAATQTGTARVDWENVLIDCNNGPRQVTSYDENSYYDVHCYGVLQDGVDVYDARTLRTGTAFHLGGTFNGGPTLFSCFEYGFNRGFDVVAPGSYKFIGCWSDGPVNTGTLDPLDAASIGIRCVASNPAIDVAEPQFLGLTISAKGTGMLLSADMYGSVLTLGAHIFGCNISIDCAAEKLTLIGAALRSYFDYGIVFRSKASADSAKLVAVTFYDNQVGSTAEIDCGGGDPLETMITYEGDGIVRYANRVPMQVTKDGAGLVVAPDARRHFEIVATGPLPAGAIGDIYPRTPGSVIELFFPGTGFSLTGGNFDLNSAFSPTAKSSIRLRCNDAGTQWMELSRNVR